MRDFSYTALLGSRVGGVARGKSAVKVVGAVTRKTRRVKVASVAGAATERWKTFAHLVIDRPVAGFEAVNLIREGYPAEILKAAGGFFGVPEARILKVAHVAPTTAHRLQKKAARIDSAATERIYRIGQVTRMAIEVFEDDDKAIEWMRQPNPALANTAPKGKGDAGILLVCQPFMLGRRPKFARLKNLFISRGLRILRSN